jgi:hypothetical protein
MLGTVTAGLAALAGCTDGGPGGEETTTEPTTDRPTTERTTTESTTAPPETTAGPGATLVNGSFENGLTGWSVGRDLPADPNKTTGVVDANASVSGQFASDGAQSLKLFVDGRQDDGTLWVQQPVDLSGVGTLAVDYYTTAGGANTITKAAVYAGPEPSGSLAEADFDVGEPLERADGGDWQSFEYDVAHDGPGLVAVGITVVWETEVTRLLDDVRLA